ncbi:MAG: ligase-associated DNA damage response endonuclease PdeM [Rhodomicrobiaceae bacterium]
MSALPLPRASSCQTRMESDFAGQRIVLDASGALYIPDDDLLLVADLHLEKGSFYAVRGNPVPCFDTRDTLARLSAVIDVYGPGRVVCLGDSFHDGRAAGRMSRADAEALHDLVEAADEWIWVSGNHDPDAPKGLPGRAMPHLAAGALTLCHRPEDGAAPMIAGHFHPKHGVNLGGRRISARCFILGRDLLLMPAFGAYAGGLSSAGEAVASLFAGQARWHALIYGDKLWVLE